MNGQNVEGLRHAEVVACIKAREDEARLLVVDPETDAYFKRLRVTPTQEHMEGGWPPWGPGLGRSLGGRAIDTLSPQVHCHHLSPMGPAQPR